MVEAKRRLAAILAADVAGYSRLMGADEAATLSALNECRSIFRERIRSHHGRVVDTAGDSILAVFDSIVEAAQSAIEIQRELAARNERFAEDRRMRFRIGINLGDVIEQDDGTVYGDGVNVAARLESIAAPEGITASASAHDFIKGKIEAPMRSVGEHEVKNIARPVQAFEIDWRPRAKPAPPAETIDQAAMHSIAVLPFSAVGGDEDSAHFANGLAEEILDLLSRGEYYRMYSRWPLKVASRNASLKLADGADPSSVARRLGVHYLLEGSARRMGASLRVSAQLIRAEDAFHVWSKSYQHQVSEGFELQTRLAQNIAHLVTSELQFDVWKRLAFSRAIFSEVEPAAVRHYVDAEYQYRLIRLGEGGDWTLYEQLLKRATQADPSFSVVSSILAFTYMKRLGGRLTLPEAAAAAHAAIEHALVTNPGSFIGRWQHGEIQLNLDLDYAGAEATFRQLLGEAPNNIWLHYNLATIALREGRVREASRLLATASALDAGYEQAGFLNSYAWLLNVTGDHAMALKVCAKGLGLALGGPERAANLSNQAMALLALDQTAQAEPLIAEAWDLNGREQPELYAFFFAAFGDRDRARRILGAARADRTSDKFAIALGTLALGEVDAAFTAIEAAIEDHDARMVDSLRSAAWWGAIRADPRYGQMVALLESKERHTEQYVKEQRGPVATASEVPAAD
jgi:adenylate cyclase